MNQVKNEADLFVLIGRSRSARRAPLVDAKLGGYKESSFCDTHANKMQNPRITENILLRRIRKNLGKKDNSRTFTKINARKKCMCNNHQNKVQINDVSFELTSVSHFYQDFTRFFGMKEKPLDQPDFHLFQCIPFKKNAGILKQYSRGIPLAFQR